MVPSDWLEECFTPMGVRLRARTRTPGHLAWLFLPGGPGLGSESLAGLVDHLQLPGTSWLVDLPGDGSNRQPPGAPRNPYLLWPDVFLEAVSMVTHPVAVGHSTGGEYLLSIPELERRLVGLALISSAPDAGWMPVFEQMVQANPLPAVQQAKERYEASGSGEDLRAVSVASAPWTFTPEGLSVGVRLLQEMPYNPAADEWSAEHFDTTYVASWWPRTLPTLIISGSEDRIVAQHLWDDPFYQTPNVTRAVIHGAAHFPWLDRPADVRRAFHDFARSLHTATSTRVS